MQIAFFWKKKSTNIVNNEVNDCCRICWEWKTPIHFSFIVIKLDGILAVALFFYLSLEPQKRKSYEQKQKENFAVTRADICIVNVLFVR